jgi:hypothetical protein
MFDAAGYAAPCSQPMASAALVSQYLIGPGELKPNRKARDHPRSELSILFDTKLCARMRFAWNCQREQESHDKCGMVQSLHRSRH